MAKRVQVTLVDDYDGGEAHDAVQFALDGVTYEIDLSDENAATLRETFESWVENARRTGGRRRPTRRNEDAAGSEDSAQVRQWGKENGWKVGQRGALSDELREAYAAAQ